MFSVRTWGSKAVLQYGIEKSYCSFCTNIVFTAILAVQTVSFRIFLLDSPKHNHEKVQRLVVHILKIKEQSAGTNLIGASRTWSNKYMWFPPSRLWIPKESLIDSPCYWKRRKLPQEPFWNRWDEDRVAIYGSKKVTLVLTVVVSESRKRAKVTMFECVELICSE